MDSEDERAIQDTLAMTIEMAIPGQSDPDALPQSTEMPIQGDFHSGSLSPSSEMAVQQAMETATEMAIQHHYEFTHDEIAVTIERMPSPRPSLSPSSGIISHELIAMAKEVAITEQSEMAIPEQSEMATPEHSNFHVKPHPQGQRKNKEHPHELERAQQALKQQLLERKEDLNEKMVEKGLLLKKASRKREEAGVQLYSMQKALASIHISLRSTEESLSDKIEQHSKADEKFTATQNVYQERRTELQSLVEKTEAAQTDLERLAYTLKQIESCNEALKNEIAVNRRATYGMEDMIVKAEKIKKDQDFFVGIQQERLRHFYQRQALCRSQLDAQQRETKMAFSALAEFDIEMESMRSQKREIANQWNSALLVLGRCDEALQALQDALRKQKEQELEIHMEKERFIKEIRIQRDMAEEKSGHIKKTVSQMKALQKRINKIVGRRSKILQKYAQLMVSMEHKERHRQKVQGEREALEQEIKAIDNSIVKQSRVITELESKMLQRLSDQLTLERATQQIVQGTLRLRHQVREERMIATEIEFKFSRVRVEAMAVESSNQTIRDTLASWDEEVKQKHLMISKMQLETRQRNGEIEVKTKEIDKLNKQYEKLTANLADKDQTPWENIITNIRYEISVKIKSSGELQKRWLTSQTELVTLTRRNNALSEKLQQTENDKILLVQRNSRLGKELNGLQKYIKNIDHSVRLKHYIITRLNEMIAKNTCLNDTIANDNLHLKMSLDMALKDLEVEAMHIEFQKQDCNIERSDVSREVAELQNHVILWKRKINYERETQEALIRAKSSPSAMLVTMRKEYERLKWKLDGLQLHKQKLIADIETRVMNRKTITVKVKAMNQRKQTVQEPDSAEALLVKSNSELRREIREVQRNIDALEQKVNSNNNKRDELNTRLKEIDAAMSLLAKEQQETRMKIEQRRPSKITKVIATAMQQRMVKRQQDFKANKWRIQLKTDLETEFSETCSKVETLCDLLQEFRQDFPIFESKFHAMTVQLKLALEISV